MGVVDAVIGTTKKRKRSKPNREKFKKQGCLTPKGAEMSVKWVKPEKNHPIAGARDEFVMKVAQDFAKGKIDYEELKFRLRYRKPSKGRTDRIVTGADDMLQSGTTT